jgi:hypothetical protein
MSRLHPLLLLILCACTGEPAASDTALPSDADVEGQAGGAGAAEAATTPPAEAGEAAHPSADASTEHADAPADMAIEGAAPTDGALPEAAASDVAVEGAAPTGPLKLYVAPGGDDAKTGLSLADAVLTLKRVHAIVAQSKPGRDVEVRIAPGRYHGQKVTWTYTMPDHRITFMPLNNDKNRPVYDGCLVENVTEPSTQCPGGTWFILDHAGGTETNLHFEYIRVERYGTAISLNGNRNAEATSNGSNRLFGCYFWNIGNGFNPALAASTAAVRLVNSDDNEIINNHFVDIINASSGGLLHAIYAAHMSDRNLIQANRFERGTGDPVRIRDYSNDNRILANRFIKIGTAAYSDWYCDHEVETACTKPAPECPSWRNEFRDNVLDGSWSCQALTVWKLYQDDITAGCTPPPGAARVSTSGNTQQTPPCSG